jgi:hypothetical protein
MTWGGQVQANNKIFTIHLGLLEDHLHRLDNMTTHGLKHIFQMVDTE